MKKPKIRSKLIQHEIKLCKLDIQWLKQRIKILETHDAKGEFGTAAQIIKELQ